VWRTPVLLAPALPPAEDPALAAILEGLCKAVGATCCELRLSVVGEAVSAVYHCGSRDAGDGPPLVIQSQPEGRLEARWQLCGAGDGPASNPRALQALEPLLEGALTAIVDRWSATRQLDILAQILGVSDDSILLVDRENEIRYANAAGERLLSLHTEKPMARAGHDGALRPLWDLLMAEIEALRQDDRRARHASVALGDGNTWEVEIVSLVGPGSLGHVLVVMSEVRFPDAAEIRERLERHRISKREAEVLALVLRGMKACEVADALEISEYTVKDHLKHAYAKLGISSRTQLLSRLTGDGALPI